MPCRGAVLSLPAVIRRPWGALGRYLPRTDRRQTLRRASPGRGVTSRPPTYPARYYGDVVQEMTPTRPVKQSGHLRAGHDYHRAAVPLPARHECPDPSPPLPRLCPVTVSISSDSSFIHNHIIVSISQGRSHEIFVGRTDSWALKPTSWPQNASPRPPAFSAHAISSCYPSLSFSFFPFPAA